MKEYEAVELGFRYTGMSARAWDFEKEKVRAQEIKKAFKGADFRIVDKKCETRYGKEAWKVIYGNEIFCKAQYFHQEVEEEYFNKYHQANLDKLREEYEKKVAEEMERYTKRKEVYDSLMALKKNK